MYNIKQAGLFLCFRYGGTSEDIHRGQVHRIRWRSDAVGWNKSIRVRGGARYCDRSTRPKFPAVYLGLSENAELVSRNSCCTACLSCGPTVAIKFHHNTAPPKNENFVTMPPPPKTKISSQCRPQKWKFLHNVAPQKQNLFTMPPPQNENFFTMSPSQNNKIYSQCRPPKNENFFTMSPSQITKFLHNSGPPSPQKRKNSAQLLSSIPPVAHYQQCAYQHLTFFTYQSFTLPPAYL